VALDARTGRQIWRVERDEKSNWATPYVWQNEKRTELITTGSKRVRSYDRLCICTLTKLYCFRETK